MDRPSRDTMDASIRAYLEWCENEGVEVPDSFYEGIDSFLDEVGIE